MITDLTRTSGGPRRPSAPRAERTRRSGRAVSAGLAVVLLAGAAGPARAQAFALVMQGVLDERSSLVAGGTATPLAGPSPFTLEAFFDARSANLVAPIGVPGFVAYAPSAMQLTLGGRTYAVQAFGAAHPAGFAVAIFDSTTPFGVPNRYGVGLIQDPLADGAGIIADFVGARSSFQIGAGGVVPTTFTGYRGVGVTSGVCTVGRPPNCRAHAVTPIPLTWAGQAFGLALGSYDDDAPATPAFAASIVAVPEPGTLALLAAGLAGAGAATAARRRARR